MSDALEVALELPGRDDLVERRDGLAERARDLRQRRILVRVPLVERRRLELPLDAVEAGGDRRRVREVRVRVRPRDAVLDAQRVAAAANAEARRAVIPRPRDPGRGEGPGLVALVRVHVRRVEPRELARERDLARDPVAEERRAVRRAVLVEDVSLA